jgi:hypothetical protein
VKHFINISIILCLLILVITLACSCEKGRAENNLRYDNQNGYRIMFWNTENLFDYENDSLKEDDEFLPSGIRHWTKERYQKKLFNVYKTILAAGLLRPPEIIGLCEIENRKVLFDLLKVTPLSYFKYRFVHHESQDRRGIDVALLYDPLSIKIVEEHIIPVDLSGVRGGTTRDILYVRAKLSFGDTISFFVNHWPSKYGGAGITEDFRRIAAEKLRNSLKEIQTKFLDEKIIIMGDFNDPPESNSISVYLRCEKLDKIIHGNSLYNLSETGTGDIHGTIKYEGMWELMDQFIVNGNSLKEITGLHTGSGFFNIFSPAFLLENDDVYGGKKPFRTWNGMKYQGGFSDHLPVILDLVSK